MPHTCPTPNAASRSRSCSTTAAGLEGNGLGASGDWDPRDTQLTDYCTLTITSGAYDGSLSVKVAEGEKTAEAVVGLSCLSGGEWEEDTENDSWTYTGDVWNGNPTAYSLDVEGMDGPGSWEIHMDGFSGNLLDDFSGTEYPGTGAVGGAGDVEWCADFGELSSF